jgi:ketosteroid isomerase-like protein
MNQAFLVTQFRAWRVFFGLVASVIFLGLLAPGASAQKKKNQTPPPSPDDHVVAMTDEQQVDYVISEMLAAWQLGDLERMHKTYADDVVVVSGTWGPPVIGWANYSPLYQAQRSRMQQIRMDRVNTFTKVSGTTAWVTYQWEFNGTVDGQLAGWRGETTLIMQKRDAHWLIVHNHTSVLQTVTAQQSASQATPRQ